MSYITCLFLPLTSLIKEDNPPDPGQRCNASFCHPHASTQVQVLQAAGVLAADAVNAPVVNVGAIGNVEAFEALKVFCESITTKHEEVRGN